MNHCEKSDPGAPCKACGEPVTRGDERWEHYAGNVYLVHDRPDCASYFRQKTRKDEDVEAFRFYRA